MSKWVERLVAVVMVAAIAFSAVGFASAQGPDDQDAGGRIGASRPGQGVVVQVIAAAADASGMTPQELLAAARDADEGQTLSAILTDLGVDPQSVVDAVKAEMVESINTAADNGKISAEQAETAINELDDLLDKAMNSELPLRDTPVRDQIGDRVNDRTGDIVENTLLGVLAELAGADVQEIVRDAITPPTLAEIAESYGLDADAIIAETESRVAAEVNQKVEDGTISAEQGDMILEGLHDRLVERFDSPLGAGQRGERPGGQGQRGAGSFGA